MPTGNRGPDWYRRPELILSELLQGAARGDSAIRHYYRAVVLAVDLDGGLLQNEAGVGGISFLDRDGQTRKFPALTGPDNPRGSVKARVLSDGLDRLVDDDDTRVFWPMFPQDQIGTPISPGEHVYVVFDGDELNHGLWLSRVPGHDSANSFRGEDSYTAPSAQQSAMDFFEPNEPEYQRTDSHAGLAPPSDPNSFFEDGA